MNFAEPDAEREVDWRHLGCGPRSFKVGRHVRYWRTDLILWLTEQSNRSNSYL